MTEDRPPLNELLQKAGDGDFLRAVAESVLQLLMEADVEGPSGGPARTGRRSAELAQRLPRPYPRHAAWLAQPQDPEAAGLQRLPAVPGGAQDDGKGVGRRHPGGLDRRGVDAPGGRDRAGDGAFRHLEEPGLETVQGNRRAREGLPRTAARGRVALSVARCDLPEGARGRDASSRSPR